MESPKPAISQGALDKFSYLDLVEMHERSRRMDGGLAKQADPNPRGNQKAYRR